jgi:hypothetical protein
MKGIIRRLRPSPAMVVACIALTFAMTGAGYAAGMLGPNTVGTKQLKKNAVISSKVKNRSLLAVDFKSGQLPRGAQGPQGPQGAQGPAGPAGPQGPQGPGARWAAINPDGSIALQSGGITVSHTTTGVYIVNFGENVSRRMVAVTPGTVNDPSFRGSAVGSSCAGPASSGGLIDCPATNPQNFVFVGELASGDATTEDHGFYVAVIGPDAPASSSPGSSPRALPGPFSAK